MDKSRVELRVIDARGEIIAQMLEMFAIGGISPESPPEERLRLWQQIASVTSVVIAQAADKLNIADAVVDKFWKEIALLEAGRLHTALGYPSMNTFATGNILSRLSRSVHREFSKHPTYNVGQSQRYVVPVFGEAPSKSSIELLAKALGRSSGRNALSAVGSPSSDARIVRVVYDDDFDVVYRRSSIVNRELIRNDTAYVLCGVHGGRDTHDYNARDSLAFFAKTHRLPLTLAEALALYIAHPDFLSGKNANVILLGEECCGKYVTLRYDEGKATLTMGLMDINEEMRASGPSGLLPHQFHVTQNPPTYGKPSAGMVIVP